MTNATKLFEAFEANAAATSSIKAQNDNLSENLLEWFKNMGTSGVEAFVEFARETKMQVAKPIELGGGYSFSQKGDGFQKVQSSSLRSYLSTLRNATQEDIAAASKISDLRVKTEDDPRIKAIKNHCAALVKAGKGDVLDQIMAEHNIEL